MAKSLSKSNTRRNGFTLVELMVVVGIIAISFGTGIAAYNRFNNKQTLIRAAQAVEGELRNIQKKADSGDRSGCTDELVRYDVRIVTSPAHSLVYEVYCDDGSGPAPGPSVGTYSLETAYDNKVIFTTTTGVSFLPLSQGIGSGTTVIGLEHTALGSSEPASITIEPSGAISCEVDGKSC